MYSKRPSKIRRLAELGSLEVQVKPPPSTATLAPHRTPRPPAGSTKLTKPRACIQCTSKRKKCLWPEEGDRSSCLNCLEAKRECTPQDYKVLPKTRKGKVLDSLRQRQNPFDVIDHLNISKSSISSRIARDELAGSLLYHLLDSSRGVSKQSRTGIMLSFNEHVKLCDEFFHQGLRAHQLDKKQEILLWSSAALGARRSNHSELVGSSDSVFQDTPKGVLRESACVSLANRALNAAEEAGVFTSSSISNLRYLTLLRFMLLYVLPSHPTLRMVLSSSHRHRSLLLEQKTETNSELDRDLGIPGLSIGLAGHDAFVSARLHLPCILSISDIEERFGWTPQWRSHAVDSLRDLGRPNPPYPWELKAWAVTVTSFVIRDLNKLVSVASFSKAHAHLDAIELSYRSSNVHWDAQLSMLPTMAELHLLATAKELHGERQTDELLKLVQASERRVLRWLPRLLDSIASDSLQIGWTESPNWIHSTAMHFEHFAIYPGWIELARKAVEQRELGKGPLSSSGFNREHLNSLRYCLGHCANVFASSAVDLAALGTSTSSILQLGNDDVRTQQGRLYGEVDAEMDNRASKLVFETLSEVSHKGNLARNEGI